MDNFDEKLNAVLSSPEAMDKIMGMARSMGGGGGGEDAAPKPSGEPAAPAADLLGSLFGDNGFDPKLMGKALQLFNAYSRNDPQKAALMQAVKPYLRPARRERVDQAMQTLKLANVAKEALDSDMLGGLFNGILGRK